MKIYNVNTRKAEKIPETELQNAILNGTHTFSAKAKIPMRDTDGKAWLVDAPNVLERINAGYNIETSAQGAVREYVKENDGLKGDIKVALGQFADEALMGLPEIVLDKTMDPLEVAKKEALKKDHEVANTIGGLTGFGTSLLYGGPLFKGAAIAGKAAERAVVERLAAAGVEKGASSIAKSITAKMLGNAARMGVESAVVSSPKAITEAMLGDPELATETIIANGLAGSALGFLGTPAMALLKGAGKVAKGAGKVVLNPLKKQVTPKDVVVNIYDPTPTELRKFVNKHGESFQDDLLNLTKKIGMDLDTVSPDEFLPKVQQYLDDSVSKLDELAETAQGDVSSQEVGNKILKSLTDLKTKVSKGVGGAKNKRSVQNVMDEIEGRFLKEENRLTAKDLLDLKRATSQNVSYERVPGARSVAEDALDKVVKDADSFIDDIVQKNNPEIKNAWRNQNKEVSILLDVIEPLKRKAGRDIKRPLAGVGNVIAVGGGATIGGPLGLVAGAALSPAFRDYRNYGILYAEGAMKKIAQRLDGIPEKLANLKNRVKVPKETTSLYAMSRLLGTQEKDREKNLDELRQRVVEYNENPYLAQENTSKISSVLSETGAPGLSEAYALKNALISKYFDSTIPKPPMISTPFHKYKWKPTDAEISKFERRVHAVENPMSVLDDLEDGTLTHEAVDAIQNVYPKLYERIKEKVIESLQDKDEELPYQARLQLSLLMGEAVDPSLQNIALYQNQYKKIIDTPIQGKNVKMPSIQTETQRISAR